MMIAVGRSVNRYKLLKKDARTVAAQQVARLESPCACAAAGRRKNFQLFLLTSAGSPLKPPSDLGRL
ncbi:hypothetical protein ACNKHT_13760 [Shigella flexneri]